MQLKLLALQLLAHITDSLTALYSTATQCTCPGFRLTYECTIMDGHASGATVWTGSAFKCPETENELIFLHSGNRFTATSQGCNDGAITGHGVRIEQNRYTSQVNITVESYMDGKGVECLYDQSVQGLRTLVSNSSIMITSAPFPPPTDITVKITDVKNGSLQLAFKWTPVAPNCSTIGYIITFDCGSCPNATLDAAFVCTDIRIGSQCNFTVQTSVCDSLRGNRSTISLLLKELGPDTPEVSVIPVYSYDTGNLSKVMITFNKLDNYFGLNHSYYISLMAVDSGVRCGSTNISESACMGGVCKHTYSFSSYHVCLSSENIIVNVWATNALGNGIPHNTTVGFANTYFKVNFNANFTQATCKLLYLIRLECTLVYNNVLNESHDNNSPISTTTVVMGTSQTDTVILNLVTLPNMLYHFTATATSGPFTTVIEGTFTRQTAAEVMSPFTVSGLVFGAVVGAMGTTMVIIIVTATFTVIAISYRRIYPAEQSTGRLEHSNRQSTDRLEHNNRESLSHNIDTEMNVAYETILGTSIIQDSHQ